MIKSGVCQFFVSFRVIVVNFTLQQDKRASIKDRHVYFACLSALASRIKVQPIAHACLYCSKIFITIWIHSDSTDSNSVLTFDDRLSY